MARKTIFAFSTMTVIACGTAGAETVRIGGTGVALGGMAELGRTFEATHPDADVEILPSLGSSGGVSAMLAGAIDIAVSSRDLKDAEREAGASAMLYATTPLAVVTSIESEAEAVTTADLEAIYSGDMTHWPDGSVIRIVLRPPSETDTKLLRQLSAGMEEAVDAALERPGLVSATNDQENASTLEDLPGSIGLVALGQIATERRRLKLLALDGRTPSKDDETDFQKELYVVAKDGMSPLARAFIDFVFSDEARQILASFDHRPAG